MIDSDSTIKLSDFGAAKQFIREYGQADDSEIASIKLGESREAKKSWETPYWMAPEVFFFLFIISSKIHYYKFEKYIK